MLSLNDSVHVIIVLNVCVYNTNLFIFQRENNTIFNITYLSAIVCFIGYFMQTSFSLTVQTNKKKRKI